MPEDHQHGEDIFYGPNGTDVRRGPWVVESSDRLDGQHSGSICVHEDAEFTISAGSQHSGSLAFRPSSSGSIIGQHSGSLHVGPHAVVEVIGDQSGSVHIERNGLLKVAPGGKLAGSLYVEGTIENLGTRGGSTHLAGGEIHDLDGGRVKSPIEKDGMNIYQW